MQFVAGKNLTSKMKVLASRQGPRKIAIAYWGKGALKLLRLRPNERNVQIICCLKHGKSDPDVIKQFGRRARQNDRLHAKIVWTPRGAIIGSANASSNGLPEEEDIATTLIEAGVYVDDKATLREVDSWFMSLFNRSKIVTPDDLAAAKAFRNKNDWKGSRSARRKRPLVEALSTGGEAEFSQQRIYFAFFDERMSQARERQARQFLKRKSHAVQRRLALDPGNFRHLVYYDGFDRMPKDAFIIDIYRHRRGFSVTGPYKTFSAPATWNGITYVLSGRHVHFNYLLTRADKATIRKAASALWKLDKPILDLRRAAPVLLKHS